MRIILDEDEDDCCYIEIQLTEQDLKKLLSYDPIERDVGDVFGNGRDVNIYLRRIHGGRQTKESDETS